MAKQLDRVLVIDIESTCWNTRTPPGQISEIIEVGLCTLDVGTLRCHDKRSIFVRPMQSAVSPFCTDLTTITAEMLQDAAPLAEAVEILKTEYFSKQRLFASWGDYDRNHFRKNCEHYGLDFPFGPTHLNVKNLFSLVFGVSQELGLDAALHHVGLPMEGTHHRGDDDAWNTAKLLALLLKRARKGIT